MNNRKFSLVSVLAQLDEEQLQEFFAYVERHTLAEAQRWFQETHDLHISVTSISKWAQRRRRTQADARFMEHLARMRNSRDRADELLAALGIGNEEDSISEAVLSDLGHSYFDLKISGDQEGAAAALTRFVSAAGAVSKLRTGKASKISAEASARRIALSEEKLRDLATEAKQSGLSDEATRTAIIDKVDEILGLKK